VGADTSGAGAGIIGGGSASRTSPGCGSLGSAGGGDDGAAAGGSCTGRAVGGAGRGAALCAGGSGAGRGLVCCTGGGGSAGAGVRGTVGCGSAGSGVVRRPGSSKSRSCGLPTVLVGVLGVSCVWADATPPVDDRRIAPASRIRGLYFIDFIFSVNVGSPSIPRGQASPFLRHPNLQLADEQAMNRPPTSLRGRVAHPFRRGVTEAARRANQPGCPSA
jgi:hypothetical protein